MVVRAPAGVGPGPAAWVAWRPNARFMFLLSALAVAAYVGSVQVATHLPSAPDSALPGVTRGAAAGLFVTAGLLRLTRWRMVADVHAARAATALLLLGASLLCMPLIGPLLQHSPALMRSGPAARLLFVVPVLVLLATGTRPGRAMRQRPMLLAGTMFGCWIVTSLTVAALDLRSLDRALDSTIVWQCAEWLTALWWLALAVRRCTSAGYQTVTHRTWIAIGLVLMGVSEAVKAWGISHEPTAFAPSLSLQLIVALICVGLAGRDLRGAFSTNLRRLEVLSSALAETQHRLYRAESVQRERVHDARSAVAGVVGAARLLADPTPGTDTARLRGLMTAELDRLQESLTDPAHEPIVEFRLADALGPVVAAHVLAGGLVRGTLGSGRANGRPRASAAALGNLLANVRSHAPGATVELNVLETARTLVLIIDDDGPGIAATERARVLRRGVQGPNAGPGSGLGLHTALQAMLAQSGTLELAASPTGGTRVILKLPAPVAALGPAVMV
ncbi:hypothetical protein BH10ACT8_BH10ACT8_08940 [soil metagenome]